MGVASLIAEVGDVVVAARVVMVVAKTEPLSETVSWMAPMAGMFGCNLLGAVMLESIVLGLIMLGFLIVTRDKVRLPGKMLVKPEKMSGDEDLLEVCLCMKRGMAAMEMAKKMAETTG